MRLVFLDVSANSKGAEKRLRISLGVKEEWKIIRMSSILFIVQHPFDPTCTLSGQSRGWDTFASFAGRGSRVSHNRNVIKRPFRQPPFWCGLLFQTSQRTKRPGTRLRVSLGVEEEVKSIRNVIKRPFLHHLCTCSRLLSGYNTTFHTFTPVAIRGSRGW